MRTMPEPNEIGEKDLNAMNIKWTLEDITKLH